MDLRTPALPLVVPSRLLDACLALVLALAGGLSGLNVGALGGHDPWVAVAVLTVMGFVLYPRRRYPEVVLTAEAAGVGVMVALGVKLDAAFLSVLVSSCSAAVYGSRRTARVLLVAMVAIVEEHAQRAKLAERLRIARELHDIVPPPVDRRDPGTGGATGAG